MYQPKFTITNLILKNIGTIEACREVITNAPLIPAYEKQFQEEAIIRTVHHGTHIEGNDLSFTEAKRVLAGDTKGIIGRKRDVQEVINYRNVIKYIDKEASKTSPDSSGRPDIAEENIKRLHTLTVEKILPPDECGRYRKTEVVVKNSLTGEVTYKPPPSLEVPYLMEDFLSWLSGEIKEIHPVLTAGIIHFELVRIHPFLDGNGRTARSAATFFLFKKGYDIKKFFSLEEYYDRDAAKYYQALSETEKRKDLTPWLEYFTEGLMTELLRIKEKVQRLSVDLKLKKKTGGQIALNDRQIKIIEYIESVGFLQSKSFKSLLPMVSDDTILRDLQDLTKKKIIKKEGRTKAARYLMG